MPLTVSRLRGTTETPPRRTLVRVPHCCPARAYASPPSARAGCCTKNAGRTAAVAAPSKIWRRDSPWGAGCCCTALTRTLRVTQLILGLVKQLPDRVGARCCCWRERVCIFVDLCWFALAACLVYMFWQRVASCECAKTEGASAEGLSVCTLQLPRQPAAAHVPWASTIGDWCRRIQHHARMMDRTLSLTSWHLSEHVPAHEPRRRHTPLSLTAVSPCCL